MCFSTCNASWPELVRALYVGSAYAPPSMEQLAEQKLAAEVAWLPDASVRDGGAQSASTSGRGASVKH